jgi:G3E family GTPase
MTAPVAQVQLADAVVINKTDLAGPEILDRLKRQIHEINPSAEILTAEYGRIEPKLMNSVSEKKSTQGSPAGLAEGPKEDYERYDLVYDGTIDKISFYNFLEKFRNSIYRAKGVADLNGKRLFVEIINSVIYSRPVSEVNLDLEGVRTGISFIMNSKIYDEFCRAAENLLKK